MEILKNMKKLAALVLVGTIGLTFTVNYDITAKAWTESSSPNGYLNGHKWGPYEEGYYDIGGQLYEPIRHWHGEKYYEEEHTDTLLKIDTYCGVGQYYIYQCKDKNGSGYSIQQGIAPGFHDFEETIVPPANGTAGHIHKVCKVCGYIADDYSSYDGTDGNSGNSGSGNSGDNDTNGGGNGNGSGTQPDDPSAQNRISISQAVVTLERDCYVYNGSVKKPKIKSVILGEKILNEGADYTVTYANNRKVGTAMVIITGCGVYYDTCKKEFSIVSKGSAINVVNASGKYTAIGDGKVSYSRTESKKKSISIPSTVKDASGNSYLVTSIGKKSITGSKIKNVTINAKKLTSVNSNAFKGAKNLKKLTIKGVKKNSKIAGKLVKAARKANKNVKIVYK